MASTEAIAIVVRRDSLNKRLAILLGRAEVQDSHTVGSSSSSSSVVGKISIPWELLGAIR